jgi:endosialidase-like protein
MKNLRRLPSLFGIAFVIATLNVIVLGQANENQFATLTNSGGGVRFDVSAPHAAVTLTVIGPDNYSFSKEFKSGSAAEFRLAQAKGDRLPDGQYTYELRVTPNISKEVKDALKAAREKGNESDVLRELRKNGSLPSQSLVQSGGFMILNGALILPGATEGAQAKAVIQQPAAPQTTAAVYKGRTGYKVLRNHPRLMMFDFVIADDLIVQGSGCFGLDCVDGENFGFDTIRVKENNTRIQFDDTSTSAGFPNNNWQIRANDSGSGGANFLGFVDQGATGNSETGTIVFAVNSGASANSLRVASNSKVGLRTATPVLDMHANTTDTPAIRLEQNNTGGFTAQTWDVAGNEANFFVRDVTSGSRLPFRIRPGAPTSSVDIAANGNVGVGTASPNARLDLKQIEDTFIGSLHLRRATTNDTWAIATGIDNHLYFGYANDASLANAAADFTINPLVLTSTNGGRVGIGTNAPDQKLSVNGDASKTGGNTWLAFSDARLKNIRGTFNTGLKAVMQLQPLRYEYRANNAMGLTPNGEHIGFAAQAVQKVIPEAVTANAQGYLMVNGDPIIWTMLNAIKEQQKEIAELKQQVRQLRAAHRRRHR